MWTSGKRLRHTSRGNLRRHPVVPFCELGFHALEHQTDLVFVMAAGSARLSQVVDFVQYVLDANKPGQDVVAFDVAVALHDGAALSRVLGV